MPQDKILNASKASVFSPIGANCKPLAREAKLFYNMENEIWKDVIGYEGLYQASNHAKVKRLTQPRGESAARKKRKLFWDEYILKPRLRAGYYCVSLNKHKKTKSLKVARLLAIAFISNLENKSCVNHINGNKTDDRIENLEWCTVKENTIHAVDINLSKHSENHRFSKLSNHDVLNIRKLIALKISDKKIAKMYNVVHGAISNIHYGITWKRVK